MYEAERYRRIIELLESPGSPEEKHVQFHDLLDGFGRLLEPDVVDPNTKCSRCIGWIKEYTSQFN